VRSGALSAAGDRFVADMRRALQPLLAAPVPALPNTLAEDAEFETSIGWRLRNLRVAQEAVGSLADAWRAGATSTPVPVPTHAVPARRGSGSTGRQQLARERLMSSGKSEISHGDGLRLADLAYAADDFAAAAQHYTDAIPATSAPTDAWTGLALAHRRLATPATEVLVHRPEVVRAVWEALGSAATVSPVELAEWLSGR
jgi:hypothetical protein